MRNLIVFPSLLPPPQGYQDLGARSLAESRALLYTGSMKMEGRTQASRAQGVEDWAGTLKKS